MLDGLAKALAENKDVKEFYLGMSSEGRNSRAADLSSDAGLDGSAVLGPVLEGAEVVDVGIAHVLEHLATQR
jgi:hypothetical protein